MKILLTGGGTAGHVFPLISVYRFLREKKDTHFIYFGEKGNIEEKLAKKEGIRFSSVISGKFRPYFSLANLLTPFLLFAGFFQALFKIIREGPVVILAKGGYVTVPVVLAGFVLGKKIYLHESDSILGRSNRILFPLAHKVFVSFEIKNYPKKYQPKLIFSGLPVRAEFYQNFYVHKNERIILVFGGSSGARKINHLILSTVSSLLERHKVVLISGEKNYEEVQLIREKMPLKIKKNFHVFAFVHEEMASLIEKADLVISRAGATSIFELAAAEKPSLLIPYPYAASDHQTRNALYFQSRGAAMVIPERELDETTFAEKLKKILFDREFLQKLSINIAKSKPIDAEKIIGDEILK